MSTPVDAMQQLMAPWLTGGSSPIDSAFSGYGGTQGLLSALMQGAGPDTTQARMGAAMQQAQNQALARAQARQQLAQGSIGLERSMMMLPYMQQYYKGLMGLLGGDPGSAQGGQAASQPASQPLPGSSAWSPNATQGAQNSPQSAPSSSQSDPLALARFGAFGGVLGMPGASNLTDLAKLQMQYDPNLITQQALAKDPLTLDKALMNEATQSRDPQAYLSAYTKYLTDANRLHISSMSGNVTGFGLPPWVLQSMANYNPQSGKMTVNGRQELIPGAASTEAALEAARSGAEESAKLRAGLQPLTGANYGAGSSVPVSASAPTTSRAPAAQPAGQAALDSPDYIPPLLSGPAKAAPRPGNIGIAALGKFQEGQAEEAQKVQGELTEQAENSQMLLTQAQQIEGAARNFTPGKYADVKGEILSVLQPTGLLSDKQVKELGSYQEGQKLSIQLQALATKQLGSREAAQVFSVMGKSIPNLTLSPDGLGKISAYMEGIARYNLARAQYGQRLAAQNNVAGLNSLSQNFQQYSNPAYYIFAAASTPTRAEMLSTMPNRDQFLANWQKAAEQGLAPGPFDYEGR